MDENVYDSDTERKFAEAMETNDGVVLYAKLPSWFKVPTPLGPYNPDWAILSDQDGAQRLYFVVETRVACPPMTSVARKTPRCCAARRTLPRCRPARTPRVMCGRPRGPMC